MQTHLTNIGSRMGRTEKWHFWLLYEMESMSQPWCSGPYRPLTTLPLEAALAQERHQMGGHGWACVQSESAAKHAAIGLRAVAMCYLDWLIMLHYLTVWWIILGLEDAKRTQATGMLSANSWWKRHNGAVLSAPQFHRRRSIMLQHAKTFKTILQQNRHFLWWPK